MNKTQAFSEAVKVASSPESYDQAFQIYSGLAPELSMLVLVPFIMLLFGGAVARDEFDRSLWDNKAYWVVVFFVAIAQILMLIAFPYLVKSL